MTQHQPAALWLDQTLAAAGTSLADPVEKIFAQTDALAHATAPDTRRSGKTLVLLEAVCVILPIVWLLRTPLQLPPMLAALAGLSSPLLIVGFFWWLRWRSMGRLWSRARIVAEACRSYIGTRVTPAQPVCVLLAVVPALAPLLHTFAATERPAAQWRDAYLRDRVDDQLAYYRRQRDKALAERRALIETRTDALLDTALTEKHEWITELGLQPKQARAAHAWRNAARAIAAYRDRYGIAGPTPLGVPAETEAQKLDAARARTALDRAKNLAQAEQPDQERPRRMGAQRVGPSL